MEKKRLSYLDSLKGFAILLVVIGHTVNRFFDYYQSLPLQKLSAVIYMFHMPLFIFISGFAFEYAYKHTSVGRSKTHYRESLLNLLIMFFVFDAIFIVFKAIIGGFERVVHFSDLLLMPVKPTGEYWFFYVLILLYLLFAPSFWESDRIPFVALPLLLSLSATYKLLFQLPFLTDFTWFQLQKMCYLAVFFYMGMLYERRKFCSAAIPVLTSVAALIPIGAFCLFEKEWYLLPGVELLIALGLTMLFVYLFSTIPFLSENRFLCFLGKHSLEVYVIHLYVTEVLWRLYKMLDVQLIAVSIIGITLISVLIPLFISNMLKKTGYFNLFFKPYTYFLNVKKKRTDMMSNNP